MKFLELLHRVKWRHQVIAQKIFSEKSTVWKTHLAAYWKIQILNLQLRRNLNSCKSAPSKSSHRLYNPKKTPFLWIQHLIQTVLTVFRPYKKGDTASRLLKPPMRLIQISVLIMSSKVQWTTVHSLLNSLPSSSLASMDSWTNQMSREKPKDLSKQKCKNSVNSKFFVSKVKMEKKVL